MTFHKEKNGFLHFLDANFRVETWSERPLVGDPKYWNGVGVPDPAGKVALAGNGDNGTGAAFAYEFTRQGAACGHVYMYSILVPQIKQLAYRTPAAAAAIVNIDCNLMGTFAPLQAVRSQHKDLGRKQAEFL